MLNQKCQVGEILKNNSNSALGQFIQSAESNVGVTMVESAIEWLAKPITDEADIERLNRVCLSLGVNPLPEYNMADSANLNAVYAAEIDCLSCRKSDKPNCLKMTLYLRDGHYKVNRQTCNINTALKYISASGIPSKFANLRAVDYKITPQNRRAVEVARRCIERKEGFYLYGEVGTGKTLLCSIVAIERAYLGLSTLFYTVTDMFKDLKDFDNPVARAEKERRIKGCPCLIIDDLGAEYVSDWVSSKLFEILDCRYKDSLCTVINSNLAIGDLSSRYTGIHGSRIARRITELCALTDIT